jgi:Ca2+-binding EF-hand superfamily protein
MIMKKILMALVMIFFTASVVLAAEEILPKLDQNKYGKISKREYLGAVSGSFDRLDKSRDGSVNRDELGHMDKKDLEAFTKETDTDGDGIISKKEFEQAAVKRFQQLDKNRNGYINKAEWGDGRSEMYSPFTRFTFN